MLFGIPEHKDAHDPAVTTHVFEGFEQLTPGTMTPATPVSSTRARWPVAPVSASW